MMFSCHGWPLHHFAMMIAILFRSHLNYLGATMYDRGLATHYMNWRQRFSTLKKPKCLAGWPIWWMNISDLLYGMIIQSSSLAMKAPASLLGMIRMRAYLILITKQRGDGWWLPPAHLARRIIYGTISILQCRLASHFHQKPQNRHQKERGAKLINSA